VAALQVLACLVDTGQPASELLHRFDPLPQLLKNVRVNGGQALEAASVKTAIADAEARLSGVGRLLIRKSGTNTPRVLIIAGSDSGGGAGIQADIKTVTVLGGFAMTAITAITAQNTLGVDAIMPVPTDMVLKQMDAVIADIGVDAVKIGMIGSAETAVAVAGRLERLEGVPIVFDPVMVASSGSALADPDIVAAFGRLIAIASIVTPNAPELAKLSGLSITTDAELEMAARWLAKRTQGAVLAKGGHLPGDTLVDLLVADGGVQRWEGDRIQTSDTHGTGCTLASAIATELGRDKPLPDAVTEARRFVRAAILAAPGFGAGHGPMAHWAGLDR
jgi:hydroxymethylpyrimidine/phosphomethylpyrimidine kinase